MQQVLARKLANEARREHGLDGLRAFSLDTLLEQLEMQVVREAPLGGGEAMSLSVDDSDFIFVDPTTRGRRLRFTLAHEIGHLMLSHGTAPCSTSVIHGSPQDVQEKEANTFAAELLMPSRQFSKDIKTVHPRIDEISRLADDYQTSLTATTLRYVSKTHDLCAVIGVREGDKPWFAKSSNTTWYIQAGAPEGSLVHEKIHSHDEAQSCEIPAEVWIKDFAWDTPWQITEEVVEVAEGEWLVLLSELPDPEDDPDRIDREAREDQERRRNSFRRH